MSQVHMNSAWTKVHMSQIDELDLSKFVILGSNGSWTVHGQPYSFTSSPNDDTDLMNNIMIVNSVRVL